MRRPAPAGDARNTLARSAVLAALLVALVATPVMPQQTELAVVGERNIAIAREILESSNGDAAAFYAACMDEQSARRVGLAPLQPLFARVEAISDRATLSDTLATLDDVGINALWVATVAVDPHGSPHHVALIAPNRVPPDGYNLMTLAQLSELVPEIDWERYFRERGFPAFTTLDVTDRDYLRALGEKLRDLPRGRLRRMLHERVADAFSAWLPPDAGGRAPDIPRWKRCVALVDSEMGAALGRAWVARAFSPESKAAAQQMVANIIAAMRERIAGATWLSGAARREALAKIDGMTTAIGYPDAWPETAGGATIERDALVTDLLHARAARIAAEIAKLGMPVDRRSFGTSVLTANAYYAPLRNEIVVPAGLLQPPLFGGDDAADYGAAGAAIGHEIAHAFDERGRYFDATGAAHDWWTPQDARAFTKRAACVSENGFDRDEAVADRTGLQIAYAAFSRTAAGAAPGAKERFIDAFRAMWQGTSRAQAAIDSRCDVW